MAPFRGMMAGFSVEALRRKAATMPYAGLWQRLKRRTREVMDEARAGDFRTLSYGALAWHSVTPMAREAAMLWLIDGDADALLYVEQCIDAVDRINRDPEAYRDLIGGRPPANSHGEIALAADICRDGLLGPCRDRLLALMRDHLIDFHQGDRPYTGYGGGGNVALCQTLNAAFCALTWT